MVHWVSVLGLRDLLIASCFFPTLADNVPIFSFLGLKTYSLMVNWLFGILFLLLFFCHLALSAYTV